MSQLMKKETHHNLKKLLKSALTQIDTIKKNVVIYADGAYDQRRISNIVQRIM